MSYTDQKRFDGESAAFWKAALFGMLIGIGTVAVLAFLIPALALTVEDPAPLIPPLAGGALLIGIFLTGFCSAKRCPEKKVTVSLTAGAFCLLFLWGISLFFRASEGHPMPPLTVALAYLVCLGISLLGGFFGGKKKKRSPAHYHPSANAYRKRQTLHR